METNRQIAQNIPFLVRIYLYFGFNMRYNIFLILLHMTQAPPQSKTTLFHEYEGPGFYLAQFKTPELAIFSYYLESEGQAYLIDPTY